MRFGRRTSVLLGLLRLLCVLSSNNLSHQYPSKLVKKKDKKVIPKNTKNKFIKLKKQRQNFHNLNSKPTRKSQTNLQANLLAMNLPKNILPVSINRQPILEPSTLPRNQAVNPIPIETLTEPKNLHPLFTTLLLTILSFQVSQYTVHGRHELAQALRNRVPLGNQPFLPVAELAPRDEPVRPPTEHARDLANISRDMLELLLPHLHFLAVDQATHAVREQGSEPALELAVTGRDYGPRLESVSAVEAQAPEIDRRFHSVGPPREIHGAGDGARVEDFAILRRRHALDDHRVYVGASVSPTVAAELHDEFLASGTPGGAGMPVESMVRWKIGTAVVVRGLPGPAIVMRVGITR
jgi:hypothetical protein